VGYRSKKTLILQQQDTLYIQDMMSLSRARLRPMVAGIRLVCRCVVLVGQNCLPDRLRVHSGPAEGRTLVRQSSHSTEASIRAGRGVARIKVTNQSPDRPTIVLSVGYVGPLSCETEVSQTLVCHTIVLRTRARIISPSCTSTDPPSGDCRDPTFASSHPRMNWRQPLATL
jgi:hypothetical protein